MGVARAGGRCGARASAEEGFAKIGPRCLPPPPPPPPELGNRPSLLGLASAERSGPYIPGELQDRPTLSFVDVTFSFRILRPRIFFTLPLHANDGARRGERGARGVAGGPMSRDFARQPFEV